MLLTQHRAMDATRKPFPPLCRASHRKCLANAVCAGLCFLAVAASGTDLTTVEGVAVYSSASGGSTFYTLWNLSRLSSVALLQDRSAAVTGHDNLPSRFLCSDTGTVSNGLPVLLVRRAMPSSVSIPVLHNFFPQGPDVAAGEGHTVVASDVHSDPDMDGDGVVTSFESANGSNPAVANASDDVDGDGHSLLQEYWAGTDPRNSQSVLRFSAIQKSPASGNVALSWQSVSGKHYEIQRAGNVGGAFAAVSNVTAMGPVTVLQVPASGVTSFYRLAVKP
jgi:hypothetical protein